MTAVVAAALVYKCFRAKEASHLLQSMVTAALGHSRANTPDDPGTVSAQSLTGTP